MTVNGREVGVVWKQPFVIDVTEALRAGSNTVEIRVFNGWTNRLAGDATVAESERVLNSDVRIVGPRGLPPPVSSGLIGPVVLRAVEELAADGP